MSMAGMDMPGMKKNPNGSGMKMPGPAMAGDMPKHETV